MFCPNCNAMLDDEAQFCDKCGCKTVDRHCRNCGASMNPNSQFCSRCGLRAVKGETGGNNQPVSDQPASDRPVVIYETYREYTGAKAISAYCVSALGTVITYFVRKLAEVESSTWEDFMDNRMYVGVDRAAKPFLTIIPIMMAIISYSLLWADDESSDRSKKIAAIVVTGLILLTLLIVWVNVPQAIF